MSATHVKPPSIQTLLAFCHCQQLTMDNLLCENRILRKKYNCINNRYGQQVHCQQLWLSGRAQNSQVIDQSSRL